MQPKSIAVVLVFTFLSVAGCATAVHSDGKTVIIEHGTGDAKSAITMAQAECAKVGKTVFLDGMACPARCVSQFRCVEK